MAFAYYDLFITLLALWSLATSGTIPGFIFFNLPFMIVALLLIVGVWRVSRVGYVGSVIFTAFFIAVFFVFDWQHGIGVLADPANTVEFIFVAGAFPLFLSAFFYSVLGLRAVWRKPGGVSMPALGFRTMPRSNLVLLLALGFILGGLMVGALAGATEARLLTSSGAQADITIAQGASSQANAQFFTPATFTVKAGTQVTWANRDAAAHTVTGATGGFGSGNMDSGSIYKFTFTQPGTYQYACDYHPWMKGTIVVTP